MVDFISNLAFTSGTSQQTPLSHNQLVPDAKDNSITLAALTSCCLASHVLCSVATLISFSSIVLMGNGSDNDRVFKEQVTGLDELLASTWTTYDIVEQAFP